MTKGAKLGILVAVAVVAFGGAFLAFRGGGSGDSTVAAASSTTTAAVAGASSGPAGPCPSNAKVDAAYSVALAGDAKSESSSVAVVVTRDGKAVTGAKVCIAAAMTGMSHGGISGLGAEMPGGRYEFEASLGMRGTWAGTVTIGESGRAPASVPLTFEVQ